MATILSSTYNQTQQWSKLVDESIEDGFTAVDLMIGQGLCKTTGVLARLKLLNSQKDLEQSRQIIAILASQAAKLPQETTSSVSNYTLQIDAIAEKAKTGEAHEMHDRIEQLRVDGYKVFPRNEQEILALIDAKRCLIELVPAFNFCCQVEEVAKQTNPKRREVDNLLLKLKEFEGSDLKAVLRATDLLKTLDRQIAKTPFLFVEEEPVVVKKPIQQTRCSMNRIWSIFISAPQAIGSIFAKALNLFSS